MRLHRHGSSIALSLPLLLTVPLFGPGCGADPLDTGSVARADTGAPAGDSAFLPPGDGGFGGPGRFPGGDGGFGGGGFPGGTRDRDGDGYVGRLDCDDTDASVYPGAPERCNGVDDDCDGTSELIGWWGFDEGSGTIAYDSGPLELDGSLVGSSLTGGGHVGGALANTTDEYVELDYAELELTAGLTISAWARPTSLSGYNAVVARGVSSGVYNPYHLGYKDGGPLWATDNGSLGTALQDLSDPGAHVGAWHHIAGTWDPTTGARALYVDGVEAAADTSGPATLTYDSQPTRFGADTNSGSPTGFFRGSIDEIKILDCAADADAIANDYATGWF